MNEVSIKPLLIIASTLLVASVLLGDLQIDTAVMTAADKSDVSAKNAFQLIEKISEEKHAHQDSGLISATSFTLRTQQPAARPKSDDNNDDVSIGRSFDDGLDLITG